MKIDFRKRVGLDGGCQIQAMHKKSRKKPYSAPALEKGLDILAGACREVFA